MGLTFGLHTCSFPHLLTLPSHSTHLPVLVHLTLTHTHLSPPQGLPTTFPYMHVYHHYHHRSVVHYHILSCHSTASLPTTTTLPFPLFPHSRFMPLYLYCCWYHTYWFRSTFPFPNHHHVLRLTVLPCHTPACVVLSTTLFTIPDVLGSDLPACQFYTHHHLPVLPTYPNAMPSQVLVLHIFFTVLVSAYIPYLRSLLVYSLLLTHTTVHVLPTTTLPTTCSFVLPGLVPFTLYLPATTHTHTHVLHSLPTHTHTFCIPTVLPFLPCTHLPGLHTHYLGCCHACIGMPRTLPPLLLPPSCYLPAHTPPTWFWTVLPPRTHHHTLHTPGFPAAHLHTRTMLHTHTHCYYLLPACSGFLLSNTGFPLLYTAHTLCTTPSTPTTHTHHFRSTTTLYFWCLTFVRWFWSCTPARMPVWFYFLHTR